MMKTVWGITLMSLVAATVAAPITLHAAKASLETCQQLHDRVEYYTDLRRSGGSARKMESWKQQRDRYKEKYSDYHCDRYRNRIR